MVNNVLRHAAQRPAVLATVLHFLVRYEQARHVLAYPVAPVAAELLSA
jgi:hypothetical protein